jgi:hypothetical protein
MLLQHALVVHAALVGVLGGDELSHPSEGTPCSPPPQLPALHPRSLKEGKVAQLAIGGPLLRNMSEFFCGESAFFE